jgi:hypothetical protein
MKLENNLTAEFAEDAEFVLFYLRVLCVLRGKNEAR